MKSGKGIAYSQDDLLKVERDVADSHANAAAGVPVFVALKLPRAQVGPTARKIVGAKPTAGQEKDWRNEKRGLGTVLKISVPVSSDSALRHQQDAYNKAGAFPKAERENVHSD